MTKTLKYRGHNILINIQGEGDILIFLHGWPTNSRLWDNQVQKFKEHFKVVTLDWLGFGKSDKPDSHIYTFTAKKEILDLVVKEVIRNDEMIKIVAHDIGGPPAVLWSYENNNKLDKLILLNTIIYPFSTKLDKISHKLFKIPVLNDFIMSKFYLKNLIGSLTRGKNPMVKDHITGIIDWHVNYTKNLKLKTILEPVEEGKKYELQELEKKLLALSDKLHLVVAKEDPLCYEHMKEAIRRNPKLRYDEIDNCGHYISIDRPEELNSILNKVL